MIGVDLEMLTNEFEDSSYVTEVFTELKTYLINCKVIVYIYFYYLFKLNLRFS